MDRKFDVYGVGNAIMDLQLRAAEGDLQKFGLEKGGMKLVEPEEQKKLLEYYHGTDLHQASGGSAANTVIAVSQLGGKTAYGCMVGDDRFGSDYLKEMKNLGVHLHTQPRPGKMTGTCIILISPDAERTMNTHLGASVELDEKDVSPELIAASKWLYVEGYLFSQPSGQRVAKRAISYAKECGTKVAVTFSDGFIVEVFGDALRAAVDQADLAFANFNEAKKFTGAEDEDEIFKRFSAAVPSAVMTLSERGARVSEAGKQFFIPPFETKAIDDTGAGDMFAGGFLYGLTSGRSVEESGRLACYLASRVVSQLGPRLECDVRELISKKEFLPAAA